MGLIGTLSYAAFGIGAIPAGYLADRFGKRTVIVACKAAEIFIMALAVAALVAESLGMLLAVPLLAPVLRSVQALPSAPVLPLPRGNAASQ